jgi:hypothetical protein
VSFGAEWDSSDPVLAPGDVCMAGGRQQTMDSFHEQMAHINNRLPDRHIPVPASDISFPTDALWISDPRLLVANSGIMKVN